MLRTRIRLLSRNQRVRGSILGLKLMILPLQASPPTKADSYACNENATSNKNCDKNSKCTNCHTHDFSPWGVIWKRDQNNFKNLWKLLKLLGIHRCINYIKKIIIIVKDFTKYELSINYITLWKRREGLQTVEGIGSGLPHCNITSKMRKQIGIFCK